MYQEEAARSAGVRFYMFCQFLAVLACLCVRGGRRHGHTIILLQKQFVTRCKLYFFCNDGILCRVAFVLRGFLTKGLMIRWFLSVFFLLGAFDIVPIESIKIL